MLNRVGNALDILNRCILHLINCYDKPSMRFGSPPLSAPIVKID